MNIGERLRKELAHSKESRYAIAKATGVSQADLSLFVHRKREIGTANASKLCDYFGLDLVKVKAKKRQVKNGKSDE